MVVSRCWPSITFSCRVAFLLGQDERPKEVWVRVIGVSCLDGIQEIVDEGVGLFGGPRVRALIRRDFENEAVAEDLLNRELCSADILNGHGWPLVRAVAEAVLSGGTSLSRLTCEPS